MLLAAPTEMVTQNSALQAVNGEEAEVSCMIFVYSSSSCRSCISCGDDDGDSSDSNNRQKY